MQSIELDSNHCEVKAVMQQIKLLNNKSNYRYVKDQPSMMMQAVVPIASIQELLVIKKMEEMILVINHLRWQPLLHKLKLRYKVSMRECCRHRCRCTRKALMMMMKRLDKLTSRSITKLRKCFILDFLNVILQY